MESSIHVCGTPDPNTLRVLDWLAAKTLAPDEDPSISGPANGARKMPTSICAAAATLSISRNYRSPHHRGELDIVGWDRDVLCFIEVKTRTTRDVKPAEAAVDREKQKELLWSRATSSATCPHSCQWRFDVLAVYYDHGLSQPSFELFQNAFSVAYNQSIRRLDSASPTERTFSTCPN